MPKINRQSPATNSRTPTSRSRQSGQEEQSAWDMVDTLRLLLYGQSGTGKTTLWATFPGPILALICSGGNKPGELKSINTEEYRKKITPRIIKSSADLLRYMEGADQYETVVLDHVSGLADLLLKEVLGLEEIPVMKTFGLAAKQDYAQVVQQCMEFLRRMLNLRGNIVIVAQERIFGGEEEGADSEVIRPTIGAGVYPSLARWLNPACDYVVQMFKRPKMRTVKKVVGRGTKKERVVETQVRDKGVEWCARTEAHETYMTKFRVPRGTPLPRLIVNADYDRIMAVTRGEQPEGAEY